SAGAFQSLCAQTTAAPATISVVATATKYVPSVLMRPPSGSRRRSQRIRRPFTPVRRGGSRRYSPPERLPHILDRAELHAQPPARPRSISSRSSVFQSSYGTHRG